MGSARVAAIAACLALGGCATAGGGSFCGVMSQDENPRESILEPTPNDVRVISDRLAGGLTVVFETGEQLCNWQPQG